MGSTELRAAAQQALEALELGYDSAKAEADQYHAAMAGYRPQRHAEMDADVQKIAAAITALKAALAKPCPCGDKPADQCPGEWEPGCDLGNNPKYAKRVDLAEPFALPCPTPKACKAHCCSGHCVLRTNHQNET